MQDDIPNVIMPPRRRRSRGGPILATLVAFLLGGGAVAALAWHGELDRYLPRRDAVDQSSATGGVPTAATGAAQAQGGTNRAGLPFDAVASMETRLALLEDRFSRIDFQANAASGNAARAEALLIAFAARRMIERGESLGYVADQLRLRFADAQPRAVDTITQFAADPVTIDELGARLEALAPDLTDGSQNRSFWDRTREELASLFIVRSDSPTLLAPEARIDRARLMLSARRIGNAIDEVKRLPGAGAANNWIADALRFREAQRALDLIETTAMLEPRRLRDESGEAVEEASPLTPAPPVELVPPPAPEAAATGAE